VLEWLRARAISFCNFDQPPARSAIEPGDRVTGPIGYFRLHGRNADAWFSKTASRDEKYDYLYSQPELEQFVPLLERIIERTRETYVVANNHFLGKGAVNALELKARMEGTPLDVPPALLEAYPRLGRIDRGQDQQP
jgi:uncharacterized protein YecE (DUF72 family)